MKTKFVGVSFLVLAACGPVNSKVDAGIDCSITAAIVYNSSSSNQVKGTGTATCTGPADMTLKVCLQGKGNGDNDFSEVQCATSNKSAQSSASLDVTVEAGLLAKGYRTVVDVTVNGTAKPQQISSTVVSP